MTIRIFATLFIVTVCLGSCSAAHKASPKHAEPLRVLIIGDSISMNYTPRVRALLGESAVVIRPTKADGRSENCEGTNKGIKHIDRWLAQEGGNWDVIHFNFGLHDIKHVNPNTGRGSGDPTHTLQAPLPTYTRQLDAIIDKMQSTGAVLVFATTTPVPEGPVRPYRDVNDAALYNQEALAIMRQRNINVNDLYEFALPRLDELQKPANVHFRPKGSQALAEQVANAIRLNAAS